MLVPCGDVKPDVQGHAMVRAEPVTHTHTHTIQVCGRKIDRRGSRRHHSFIAEVWFVTRPD